MRNLVIVGALALAACSPAEEAERMSAGCDARAVQSWTPTPETTISLEASTAGPDCGRAVATIVARDSSGAPLFAEAYLTEHIMGLHDARDPAAMQAALTEWVNASNNTTIQTTSALPDWPQGADGPQNGEFPFYVDQAYDRESYLVIRRANVPLLCYVQGMESMACLALYDVGLEKVGVQTFPG